MDKALELAVEKCLKFRLNWGTMSCSSCDAYDYFEERNIPLPCKQTGIGRDVENIELGGQCINCK